MFSNKILIIGTVPYNENLTSRSFQSYFYNIKKENLFQIFSDKRVPVKGHCSELYQITDEMLMKKFINRKFDVGRIFKIEELEDNKDIYHKQKNNRFLSFIKTTNNIRFYLRWFLWKEHRWYSIKLYEWLNNNRPDMLVISFSNDLFIFQIAKKISKIFDIPIVFIIGDDYLVPILETKKFLRRLYDRKYLKLVTGLFKKNKYSLFISEKIKNEYTKRFYLEGKTIYLSPNIGRRPFKRFNNNNPKIRYFGNLGADRYKSLLEISDVFDRINPNFVIEIYSGTISTKISKILTKQKNIIIKNPVSYDKIQNLYHTSDLVFLVEAFSKNNILKTRFSLSTKVADSLNSGANLFAYGSNETGLIDYLKKEKTVCLCDSKALLEFTLRNYINDPLKQEYFYKRGIKTVEKNHNIEHNNALAESIYHKAVKNYRKNDKHDEI